MNADAYNSTIREIGIALGVKVRAAQCRAKREQWPFVALKVRGGKQRRYPREGLPEDVRTAILTARALCVDALDSEPGTARTDRDSQIDSAWKAFENAKGWQRRIAERRQAALLKVAELRAQGLALQQARERVVTQLCSEGASGRSASALKRWGRAVRGIPRPHWLAFLVPDERGRRAPAQIHPGAWAAFKQDLVRPERPTAESCYRRLERQAKQQPDWLPLASLDTFERRTKSELPAGVRTYMREGKEALKRLGPKIARDRSGIAAMEHVNSDGHRFDVAVKYPNGSIGRPTIVGWQDMASGKLLSHRIGYSETSDLVRLSILDMVERYGIPRNAHVDNGRAYASKKITGGIPTRYRFKVREEELEGILKKLGISTHFVTPYNGQAKPIERAWGDLARDISKRPEFAGAYLGSNPTDKPENYGSRAVAYDEFVRVVADGIREHNAREGRRSEACNGRSLDATFAAKYSEATVTKATQQQLAMLLLASELVKVLPGTGEVHLAGNRYWSEGLCEHQGELVELRFDPEALHDDIHVFARDGTLIDKVSCVFKIGFETSDESRSALRAQRAYLKKQKELAKAERERNAAVAPRFAPAPIPDPPLPSAAVIALHIPRRKDVPATAPEPSTELSETERTFIEWMPRIGRAEL